MSAFRQSIPEKEKEDKPGRFPAGIPQKHMENVLFCGLFFLLLGQDCDKIKPVFGISWERWEKGRCS